VFFLLSCNVAEILIIFISMLLGWPIPLLPIHLLWNQPDYRRLPGPGFGYGKERAQSYE
jgi:Ca2+-transporting ATPase